MGTLQAFEGHIIIGNPLRGVTDFVRAPAPLFGGDFTLQDLDRQTILSKKRNGATIELVRSENLFLVGRGLTANDPFGQIFFYSGCYADAETFFKDLTSNKKTFNLDFSTNCSPR